MWIPVLLSEGLTDEPTRVDYWGVPVVVVRTASRRIAAVEEAGGHTSTVRCFSVREAWGLVWISIESDETAPFPLTDAAVPPSARLTTGDFEVRGDVRRWIELMPLGVPEDDRYDERPVGRLRMKLHKRTSHLKALLQSGGLLRWLYRALRGAYRVLPTVEMEARLVNPLVQRITLRGESGFGRHATTVVTAVVPLGEGRNRIVYSGHVHARGWPATALGRHVVHGFVRRLVLEATQRDAILRVRGLFDGYLREKSHLYPRESHIHRYLGAREAVSPGAS
jgi:hypothetical protein